MPGAPVQPDGEGRPSLELRAAAACALADALRARARRALDIASDLRRERTERWLARYGRAIGGAVFVSRCAWCRRVREGQGDRWLAVAPPAMPAIDVQFTHGICPVCAAGLDAPEG